jgi:hypothetical protein
MSIKINQILIKPFFALTAYEQFFILIIEAGQAAERD